MLPFLLACVGVSPLDSVSPPDTARSVDAAPCADTGSLHHETAETGDSGADTSAAAERDIPTDTGAFPTSVGPVAAPPVDELVIYAVRHAEKATDSADPGLTEEGAARAEALAVLMTDVPLAAIYATELRRTQETVQPTADDHGLPVVTDIDPEEDLATWIRCVHAAETVLHAGHSYTLPDFFEALGLADVPSIDGYGQLFQITFEGGGGIRVEETRYGD